MIFRFRHNVDGGHVRVGVFAASAADRTFEKVGDLTLGLDQWPDLRTLLQESPGFLAVHGRAHDGTIDVESCPVSADAGGPS